MSRRTKKWWNILTKFERNRLVYLERSKSSNESFCGGGTLLPSGCTECPSCDRPTVSFGLCDSCFREMNNIIKKANGD